MENTVLNVVEEQVVETTKKFRGRPKGSVDPVVTEAKKTYSKNQVLKLEERKLRVLNDLQSIEEKIEKHNVFING